MAGVLGTRVLSAVVLAVPTAAIFYVGSPLVAVLAATAAAILAWEWTQICAPDTSPVVLAVTIAGLVAAVASAGFDAYGTAIALVVTTGVVAFALSRFNPWYAGGVLYVGWPCVGLVWLRDDPANGLLTIIWILGIVWASDIGAYATGRTVGGPKLAPRVSPNKTWSGFAGGVACGALAGLAVALWSQSAKIWALMLVSAALGGVAQGGDLLESWFKRRYGVKDASHLIPGHGGLLDRVDGLTTVVVVISVITLAAKGSMLTWLL